MTFETEDDETQWLLSKKSIQDSPSSTTSTESRESLKSSPIYFGKNSIDLILEKTGGMGRYQIALQILSFVIMVTVSHQALDMYFLAEDPSWSCRLQGSNTSTLSYNDKGMHNLFNTTTNAIIPTTGKLKANAIGKHETSIISTTTIPEKLYNINPDHYNQNLSTFCRKHQGEVISDDNPSFEERCSLDADEWAFNIPNPDTFSIITEFKLYCGKESMASLAHSSYFIGSSIGSIFMGYSADRYGRKYTFCALALIMFCSNMSTYFVTQMWQFIMIRLIVGASGSGCMNAMYVQVFEFMLPQHRAITSNLVQISYGTAIIYLACIAHFLTCWRQIIFYTTIPCTLAIFVLAIYQSPRWLLQKKRYKDAELLFTKLSKFNKRPIEVRFRDCTDTPESEDSGSPSYDERKVSYSIFDCFKYKKTAVVFFTILLLQYFGGIVYYTMYLEFNRIGGSKYLILILAVLADFPGLVIASYFPNKIGRKRFFMISFLVVGICVLPIVFTPKDYDKVVLVRIVSSVAVKIFFSCGMDCLVLWTLEVFPTEVRTQGLVLTSMGSKLGSATAPFVVELFRKVNYVAPFLMIVVLCVFEILLSFLLPETLGLPSREMFEDFFVEKPTRILDNNKC